ncbi:MAG: arylsulfotransferase family protein, partial [Solirubrobacteraceae bacterium]
MPPSTPTARTPQREHHLAAGGQGLELHAPRRARTVSQHRGDIFAWQHDPNALGHGEYTFFDNESAGLANTGSGVSSEFGFSRAVLVQLDERRRTATLVQSYDQPESLTAPSQGNAQTTSHGDLFVGWGSLPYFSEFSPSGELLLNAQFPTGVNSYRAYTF